MGSIAKLVSFVLSGIGVACMTVGGAGCNSGGAYGNWGVQRVDPEKTVDVDYRWQDDDAREAYRALIADCLARPWVENFRVSHNGNRPVVFVGTVRNETSDYVDTKLVTKRFEEELINSGRVRVVADRDQRGEIRDERQQGQAWNMPETVKKQAMELGADYIMLGRVGEVKQESNDRRTIVQYYQINLELIDIQSNEKVWIGSKDIKKVARR
ncbi:MAG: penicillin-binding protein activator LpoB [Phycisphaeraceae bacterium]|nr:penicillin-binding protein activator LpoB [Phycisphaeraceae bacterium]